LRGLSAPTCSPGANPAWLVMTFPAFAAQMQVRDLLGFRDAPRHSLTRWPLRRCWPVAGLGRCGPRARPGGCPPGRARRC